MIRPCGKDAESRNLGPASWCGTVCSQGIVSSLSWLHGRRIRYRFRENSVPKMRFVGNAQVEVLKHGMFSRFLGNLR